jgi:hypothetical protein
MTSRVMRVYLVGLSNYFDRMHWLSSQIRTKLADVVNHRWKLELRSLILLRLWVASDHLPAPTTQT